MKDTLRCHICQLLYSPNSRVNFAHLKNVDATKCRAEHRAQTLNFIHVAPENSSIDLKNLGILENHPRIRVKKEEKLISRKNFFPIICQNASMKYFMTTSLRIKTSYDFGVLHTDTGWY